MELGNALRTGNSQYPTKTALIVEERSWTYADLDAATDRMAAGLFALGVGPGDRVAVHFTNGLEIVVAYYACFKIGAIVVPLNTRMKGLELQYVLNHSAARFYLGQPALFAEIAPVRSGVQTIERYFLSGDSSAFEGVSPLGGLDASAEDFTFPSIEPDAVGAILYTSGTTARPKGVTHTVRTLSHLANNGIALAQTDAGDIVGIVVPVCHVFGLGMLVATLTAGTTIVMIPRFDPVFVLEQLQRHKVSLFGGLPIMLNALVNVPGASAYDVSALRACFAGGDAVPTELQRRFKDTFGVDITEACGMTEVQPYTCNPIYGRGKAGAIGLPAPGVTLRLVDPLGRDVPAGAEGEVLVRSEAMMVGYWNDPEATAATIADGWLRTGDLARVDEDGYYWFVGRKKEIIIRGGSNISPLEVEEVIYKHPAVRETGVIGVPNDALGEVVLAYVSLKSGAAVSEADLKAFIGTQVAAYKVPESILFVPELPKGLTGKIHRKTLKDWAIKPA
ncbi:MAG: AMP-binding protein [Vicinamibacterales bacterium]